jgi:hypothetical protein
MAHADVPLKGDWLLQFAHEAAPVGLTQYVAALRVKMNTVMSHKAAIAFDCSLETPDFLVFGE